MVEQAVALVQNGTITADDLLRRETKRTRGQSCGRRSQTSSIRRSARHRSGAARERWNREKAAELLASRPRPSAKDDPARDRVRHQVSQRRRFAPTSSRNKGAFHLLRPDFNACMAQVTILRACVTFFVRHHSCSASAGKNQAASRTSRMMRGRARARGLGGRRRCPWVQRFLSSMTRSIKDARWLWIEARRHSK